MLAVEVLVPLEAEGGYPSTGGFLPWRRGEV